MGKSLCASGPHTGFSVTVGGGFRVLPSLSGLGIILFISVHFSAFQILAFGLHCGGDGSGHIKGAASGPCPLLSDFHGIWRG